MTQKRPVLQTILALATSLIALAGLLSKPVPVLAQAGKSITIIPPKFELFANPGDTTTEKMRLRNESDFPVSLTIVLEDFASAGEEGHVVLEDEGATTKNYSLARWITPETTDITMQPKEERSFSFTIAVPRDAEPGGHYASVLFQSSGDTVPGSASISQRIGGLVLLRVSGNVTEDATISTFEAPKYSKTGPVTFTLRVKNEGNTHINPKGTIVITNILGQKVEEIPLEGANVLPGATRKMDTVWNKTNMIGYYTATLVATYGEQNLPLTAAIRFAVVSPTIALLLIIGGVAAVVFILSLISGRNRLLKALRVIATGK